MVESVGAAPTTLTLQESTAPWRRPRATALDSNQPILRFKQAQSPDLLTGRLFLVHEWIIVNG